MATYIHWFPCGELVVEMTRAIDGIGITECVGPLLDAFRTMHYGPVIHPEPPSDRASVAEFHEFLAALRDASEEDAAAIVAGTTIR